MVLHRYQKNNVVRQEPCPSCRKDGRDKTGNHLMVFRDGNKYCARCEYLVKNGEEYIEAMITLEEVKEIPYKNISQIKFTEKDCKYWGIKSLCNEQTGEIEEVLYPSRLNGEIKGYKARVLSDKKFYGIGNLKNPSDFFGQHLWTSNRRIVIITEGEKDAVATWKMLQAKGKSYPVISLVNGANSARKDMEHHYQWLDGFENIVLCFDSDKPGQDAVESVIPLFRPGKVKVMRLPEKDPHDMYMKGMISEFFTSLSNAEARTPVGIVQGKDTWDKMQEQGDQICIPYPDGWDLMNRKTYGRRLGDLDVWLAGTGAGKTQVFRELSYHSWLVTKQEYQKWFGNSDFNFRNSSTGIISLEERVPTTVNGILSVHMNERIGLQLSSANTPWLAKMLNIDKEATVELNERRRLAWEEVFSDNRIHFLDHFGSMEEDSLYDKIRYLSKALNCKFIYLDHLHMALSELESGDSERGRIDNFISKLKRMTQELNIWIGLVVHLRKSSGKSFEEGEIPSGDDAKGSSSIKQWSDGLYAIVRNQQHPDEYIRNTSELHILKCRFTGSTGSAGFLHYDGDSGRMIPTDNPYELQQSSH